MKINEFIGRYNEVKKNASLVEKLINEIKKESPYIPFINKVALAQAIVNATMVDSETDLLSVNTPKKYALAIMTLIFETTELEQSNPEDNLGIFKDYDLINSAHLWDVLLVKTEIKAEYEEFNTVLKMVSDDLIQNKYDNHRFAIEMMSMITSSILRAIEPITPILDKLSNLSDEEAENMDRNVNKFIDKLAK